MTTGVFIYHHKLIPMLHLHYETKILTSIGMDRKVAGEQPECSADVLKKMMFMISLTFENTNVRTISLADGFSRLKEIRMAAS